MINNFDIVTKNLMWNFPEKITPNLFWTVSLIKPDGGLFKEYFVRNQSELLGRKDEIINVCNKLNMKAFVSITPCLVDNTSKNILAYLARMVANHNFMAEPWNLLNNNRDYSTPKYAIYVKNIDIKKMLEVINNTRSTRVKKACKFEYDNPGMHYIKYTGEETDIVYDNAITVVPTSTGYEIICYDFEVDDFIIRCQNTFGTTYSRSKNTIVLLYEG